MSPRKHCWKILLLPLLAGPAIASADPLYSLTFLPQDFYAAGINNAGQVVGTAGGGAAIWSSPGSMTSLAAIMPGSEGLGINNLGDIVGRYGDNAFVYTSGFAISIATETRSWATGINDARQVTGTAANYSIGGPQSAFLFSGGTVTYIDPAYPNAGENFGNAVNNAGVIAGTYSYGGHWSDPDRQAFTYSDGTVRSYGTLGGTISEAEDINDAGALVGWSLNYEGTEEQAFMYSSERGMMNLGSLGGTSSRARGLNNLGWAVGMSDIGAGDGFDYHAFLYGEHGMVDLNSLVALEAGWKLVSAEDVNDAGQILAQACQAASGECRAVRLDLISPVPEPSTWTMLIGGLTLPALIRLRRRMRAAAVLGLTLAAAPLAAQASGEKVFRMTAVPTGFEASAINNAGQVVGTWQNSAAIWDGTRITTIARLAPGSRGLGINDRGHIVGTWHGAFIHTPAGVRDLSRFGFWATSQAFAVNDADEVAGTGYWGVGEEWRAWVFTQGILRMIGTFGGDWSETRAINRAGQVVGTASLVPFRSPYGDTRAFLYRDRVLQDLGTLGSGISSAANDINDRGQVVGGSETTYNPDGTGPFHPFLYENRTMRDLGTLGGTYAQAWAINNIGSVVGDSLLADPDNFTSHAFLYESGRMRDLNQLTRMPAGWILVWASDINDKRQILARACMNEDCVMARLDPI